MENELENFGFIIRVYRCSSVVVIRNQNSLALSVVLADGFDNPVLGFENPANGVRLAVAEFEHDFSIGFEKVARLDCEAAVEIEAVGAAVQSGARVVIADFGIEGFDFGGGDVGRVADDEIELNRLASTLAPPRREFIQAVGLDKLNSIGDVVADGILLGNFERFGGNVEGGNFRIQTFRGQRNGDAAAAGAEVQCCRGIRRSMFD